MNGRLRRVGVFVAMLGLTAAVVAAGPVAADDGTLDALDGEGTAEDPYVITDAEELQLVDQDLEAHYVLGADVDAAETAAWDDTLGFEPIGSPSNPFEGTLDGREHTVSELTIQRHDPEAVGLFGAIGADARVERIALEDVTVDTLADTDNPRAGFVAGESEGTIRQVAATGSFGDVSAQGGIVATNEGTIEESHARVEWDRTTPAGGIAARNAGSIERVFTVAPRFTCGTGGFGGRGPCDDRNLVVGVDDGGTVSAAYGHGPRDPQERLRVEGLSEDAATGSDAIESMDRLDFEENWRATASFPVLAWQYDGPELSGVGLADQPFEVGSAADLDQVRANVSAHYVLVDDVDAGETASWDGGDGFEPIGSTNEPFSGAFDGQGHVVSGLSIDRPTETNVGLFGVLEDGTVHHVGLTNVAVEGDVAVGAVAGTNRGAIEAVHVDGAVGGDRVVGGVVGLHSEHVERTVVDANVSANRQIGGLVGLSAGGFGTEVLSTGPVTGTEETSTGGLVGDRVGGEYEAAYWDVDRSEIEESAAGTGRTTADLTGEAPRSTTSLSFVEPPAYEAAWVPTDGYPTLSWTVEDPVGLDGSGTVDDPYQIQSLSDLETMRTELDAHFVLVDDVDASDTETWNDGRGFQPIGADADIDRRSVERPEAAFTGSLDGNGHQIEGLTIDRPAQTGVGLFAAIVAGGSVTDLELANASVRGGGTVGGLVGVLDGTVENVTVDATVRARSVQGGAGQYAGLAVGASEGTVESVDATGDVRARSNVGGVVGHSDGSLTASTASGIVAGDFSAGGVAGESRGVASSVTSTATVTGHEQGGAGLGGLVGTNAGSIAGSAATGDVGTGENEGRNVGGLVGRNSGTVTAAYATGNVTAGDNVGGLIGLYWGSPTVEAVYSTGAVASTGDFGGVAGTGDENETTAAYWDVEASGVGHSDVGTGLTTAELTGENASDHLEGFDFETVWKPTESYPVLVATPDELPDDEPDTNGSNGNGEAGCTTLDDGHEVCDLDGDGAYRDVNGDGTLTNGDVTTFFEHQHTEEWNERTDLFDYTGDGTVGQADVLELFEAI